MNKTRKRSALSFALCIVLIAAMALCTMGCNGNNTEAPAGSGTTTTVTTTTTTTTPTDDNVLGEGATAFTFTVTDKDGKETEFEIHTDKTTVGDALLELGLIAGEEGAYGLYVKTVNGITADYDVDGTYWAFYVNGEYAMTGVDATDITAGATYSFKAES